MVRMDQCSKDVFARLTTDFKLMDGRLERYASSPMRYDRSHLTFHDLPETTRYIFDVDACMTYDRFEGGRANVDMAGKTLHRVYLYGALHGVMVHSDGVQQGDSVETWRRFCTLALAKRAHVPYDAFISFRPHAPMKVHWVYTKETPPRERHTIDTWFSMNDPRDVEVHIWDMHGGITKDMFPQYDTIVFHRGLGDIPGAPPSVDVRYGMAREVIKALVLLHYPGFCIDLESQECLCPIKSLLLLGDIKGAYGSSHLLYFDGTHEKMKNFLANVVESYASIIHLIAHSTLSRVVFDIIKDDMMPSFEGVFQGKPASLAQTISRFEEIPSIFVSRLLDMRDASALWDHIMGDVYENARTLVHNSIKMIIRMIEYTQPANTASFLKVLRSLPMCIAQEPNNRYELLQQVVQGMNFDLVRDELSPMMDAIRRGDEALYNAAMGNTSMEISMVNRFVDCKRFFDTVPDDDALLIIPHSTLELKNRYTEMRFNTLFLSIDHDAFQGWDEDSRNTIRDKALA